MENSISEIRPDLALNWDYSENKPNIPDNVDIDSLDIFTFTCHKCKKSWKSTPYYMRPLRSCPFCYQKTVYKGVNDLESQYYDIAKDWDYERNNPVLPSMVTKGSSKTFWWKCSENHNYTSTVYDRVHGKSCPMCNNYILKPGINDFATLRPDLLLEWDWDKNNKLNIKPNRLSEHSHTLVYWKCKKGHEWSTRIMNRTHKNGTNCPYCNTANTSYPEQYLYWAFKQVYKDTINRFKTTNHVEYDIYIPSIKTCIEYSGINWHKNNIQYDSMKKELAINNGQEILVIIADHKYKSNLVIKNNVCLFNPNNNIDEDLKIIINTILEKHNHSIKDIDFDEVKTNAIKYSTGSILYEDSLEYKYPDIAKEFDLSKNNIKPSEIKAYSNKKFWWKCGKCGNLWETKIEIRTINGAGCPICNNPRKVDEINLDSYEIKMGDKVGAWEAIGILDNTRVLCKGPKKSNGILHKRLFLPRNAKAIRNLEDCKFGEWTVLEKTKPTEYNKYARYWKCRCSCGIEVDVINNSLISGKSLSCGHKM